MARRRFQAIDTGREATLQEVMVSFRDGRIEELAVRTELRRLMELFKIHVIKWYLYAGTKLTLFLHIPNRLCTEEDARKANEHFDDMIMAGFPALGDLPTVPPKKLWRKHDFSPDQLSSVPCFMHLFSQAICHRSRELQGRPSEMSSGPYVKGRYVLVALDPSRIPSCLMLPGLGEALAAWFGEPPAKFGKSTRCYRSAHSIGGRNFVAERTTAPPFGSKPSRRFGRLTVFDLDIAWHYAKETDAELERLLRERDDDPWWAEALAGDLRDFCFGGDGNLCMPMALVATLPFVMLLHAVDGTMRWRRLKRLKADGTLDMLRAKAKANARAMLGLS